MSKLITSFDEGRKYEAEKAKKIIVTVLSDIILCAEEKETSSLKLGLLNDLRSGILEYIEEGYTSKAIKKIELDIMLIRNGKSN